MFAYSPLLSVYKVVIAIVDIFFFFIDSGSFADTWCKIIPLAIIVLVSESWWQL